MEGGSVDDGGGFLLGVVYRRLGESAFEIRCASTDGVYDGAGHCSVGSLVHTGSGAAELGCCFDASMGRIPVLGAARHRLFVFCLGLRAQPDWSGEDSDLLEYHAD